MRIYIGFDDTDTADADRGTGKLARWFAEQLPPECRLWGVVRQQLPRLPGVPYTSHNSAACVVVETDIPSLSDLLVDRAAAHIRAHFIEGSDPGLCLAVEGNVGIPDLMNFGRTCCTRLVTQQEAMAAARTVHLSGHGGTNDGIIGAAAGVGLTLSGWSGRLVEFGSLRALPDDISVQTLESHGIRVLPMERDAIPPALDDTVHTEGWLRPRLWANQPVVPVENIAPNHWRVIGIKEDHERGANRHGKKIED